MSFDVHSVLANSLVTSVSVVGTTYTIGVTTGTGSLFAANQQVTICPAGSQPNLSNAMIGRITTISGDTLTVSCASQYREGTSFLSVSIGNQIFNGVTPKALTDIESNANANNAQVNSFYKRGTALSGLEFGSAIPGAVGTDYFQPDQTDFNYLTSKGLNLIRFPFLWERLQPVVNGSLNSIYLS